MKQPVKGGENAAHLVRGHVLDAAASADDAGVVDEGGDSAELAIDLGEQADNRTLIGAVGGNGEPAPVERADALHDVVGGAAILPVADGDVVAGCGGGQRGGPADAAAAAGDDDDLAHACNSLEL